MKTKYQTADININILYKEPDPHTATVGKPLYSWTITEAILFARQLEAVLCKPEYPQEEWGHIGITGGVLLNGGSGKDLDLIVFPHRSVPQTCMSWQDMTVRRLNKYLTEFYKFEPLIICSDYEVVDGDPSNTQKRDAKVVMHATRKADNRKLDLFFLI